MPLRAHTSGGTWRERWAAARMTRAITIVAERDMPHWQLQQASEWDRWECRERHLLHEDTFGSSQSIINKSHSCLETVVDEVLLSM